MVMSMADMSSFSDAISFHEKLKLFQVVKVFVVLIGLVKFGDGQMDTRPEVVIGQGTLQGRTMRTRSGREFYGFMGIPYASPPIGSLRFMAPVRHPGWGGILDVTNFRSPCPQIDNRGLQIGEENCLFINIFTPNIPRGVRPSLSDLSFPVMVYLHGGFFESGSSNIYGPEKFLDKGVILVTLNYRLGVLGFLSSGDSTAPGNWGLLDQNLALQWVRENVAAFGGNPNLVTLFGEGAGGVSVTIHLVAPQSQGLFSRAIAQSGSALCSWAIERNPLEYAKDIAKRIRCETDPVASMVSCVRRSPMGDILRAQNEAKSFGVFPLRAVPVVERAGESRFLPEEPSYLLERESIRRVPFIAGVNRDEGAFLYPVVLNLYRESGSRDAPAFLRDVLIPKYLRAGLKVSGNTQAVVETLLREYFTSIDPNNVTSVFKPFINMSGDSLYLGCTEATLKAYSRFNVPTFMYVMEYRGSNSLLDFEVGLQRPNFDTGVSHGDELLYLFQLNIPGLRQSSLLDDFVSSRMLTLWTDFARFGEAPQFVNSEYPRWETYNPESQLYYNIERTLQSRRSFRPKYVDLWLRQVPSLINVNPSPEPLIDSRLVPTVYRTVSWALVAVCIALLMVVIVLLAILYNQKKSQSFRAQDESSGMSSSSTLY